MNAHADMSAADPIERACDAVAARLKIDGPQAVADGLKGLAAQHPDHDAPPFYLAQLYRWWASHIGPDSKVLDRSKLRLALEHAQAALGKRRPERIESLQLVGDILHALGEHRQRAEFSAAVAAGHGDLCVRFSVLCWASVALECLAAELEADGQAQAAMEAWELSVQRHREALAVPMALTVIQRLDSWDGGSHTRESYRKTRRAREWVEGVTALLDGPDAGGMPLQERLRYLCSAADSAIEAGLPERACELAMGVLTESESSAAAPQARLYRLQAMGAIMRAEHSLQHEQARERTAERIMTGLAAWEQGGTAQREFSPAGGYNHAARNFIMVGDWERAIAAARRAGELSQWGSNHFFLAMALWAGRRDRAGTLAALRDAAGDAHMSGKGHCRNLWLNFHVESVFADVRDDPEFLAALHVPGVID